MALTDNERQELEELRAQKARMEANQKPINVTMGEHNGWPTLNIAGPFRPFNLGLGKIRKLFDGVAKVAPGTVTAAAMECVAEFDKQQQQAKAA